MTNETQRLKAQITFGEFLERIKNSKHKNRDKDLEHFWEAYQIFGQMQQDIQDLNNTLSQSELNNTILNTKVERLLKQNEELKKGLI